MTSRLGGSNKVYGAPSEENRTPSAPQARKQLKEGLEEKARLQQLNNLKGEIAEHTQNIKDLNAIKTNVQAGNSTRANTRANLAAKRALLEK
jgi:hypothetical protein